MQFWQCPLLLMVSLIAAINTQQTPSQRLEPNQMDGLVEQQQVQPQQQQEQPTQSDNKVSILFVTIFPYRIRVPSTNGIAKFARYEKNGSRNRRRHESENHVSRELGLRHHHPSPTLSDWKDTGDEMEP